MANKRNLKHTIHLVCEELFSECVAASLYGTKNATDNADALLFAVIKLQNNYLQRVSHPEPGMPAKKYFKDLREKFTAEVNDIVDQINNL